MNKGFVFELDGGEDVAVDARKKVVQSPWEFSGYSADVRREYAERHTTSIDQKISQVRSSKNGYKGGPRGESDDEDGGEEEDEADDDIGEVEDVDMEDEADEEEEEGGGEEIDEEEDADGVDVSLHRIVAPFDKCRSGAHISSLYRIGQ